MSFTNDFQAELDDQYWREHEGEQEVELSEAEMRIAELEATLRDIIFSCNEVIAGTFPALTASEVAAAIKVKAQRGLM
jgi:hypothetical protein